MASKINKYQAQSIATKISKRAFEHLINPAYERMNIVAVRAHNKFINSFSEEQLNLLVDAQLLRNTDTFNIEIASADGQEIRIEYRGKAQGHLQKEGWGHILLKDDNMYDDAVECSKDIESLHSKQNSLYNTIVGQISGKGTAGVLKAWPEAADIITGVTGEICEGTLTTPLEVLLARFLPMLPAPVGA